jgi:DNA (cytosine-5)-methyltransferase 1
VAEISGFEARSDAVRTIGVKVLDLFSGIGGFSLGLERAGFETVAFCEPDRYCRMVLAKHWPGVWQYERVETLSAARLAADRIAAPDLICGGFPCQDVSVAGIGEGLAGERSGLWREFARLIDECRPAWCIIENVSALRGRGLDIVLSDLAALGFDAQWHCIPASHVGAPHRRDRIWIIANTDRHRVRIDKQRSSPGRLDVSHGRNAIASDDGATRPLADADGERCAGRGLAQHLVIARSLRDLIDRCREGGWRDGPALADADGGGLEVGPAENSPRAHGLELGRSPGVEPDVGRVADGIPARVDRLKALGNSLVPLIPELIGRAILESTD